MLTMGYELHKTHWSLLTMFIGTLATCIIASGQLMACKPFIAPPLPTIEACTARAEKFRKSLDAKLAQQGRGRKLIWGAQCVGTSDPSKAIPSLRRMQALIKDAILKDIAAGRDGNIMRDPKNVKPAPAPQRMPGKDEANGRWADPKKL